jgi:hypothetical protein
MRKAKTFFFFIFISFFSLEPFELPNESERLTDLSRSYLPPSQNLIADVLSNEYLPPGKPSRTYLPPNRK